MTPKQLEQLNEHITEAQRLLVSLKLRMYMWSVNNNTRSLH